MDIDKIQQRLAKYRVESLTNDLLLYCKLLKFMRTTTKVNRLIYRRIVLNKSTPRIEGSVSPFSGNIIHSYVGNLDSNKVWYLDLSFLKCVKL